MLDKYILRYDKEINVGTLVIDVHNDIWGFEFVENYEGPLPQFARYLPEGIIKSEYIKEWVLERSPEPGYEWIDQLMERIGITEYDPYEFFKYNNGEFIHDRFSVEKVE